MDPEKDYAELNRLCWNERTGYHIDSDFYDMKGFMQGQSSLREIETTLLGDISGKSVLHLQCHFGQDSLSLARMGASVTGVDLSDAAIAKANELAAGMKLDASFICCNVYDLPEHLDRQFDIVFTTYGVIGWLPDMDRWAAIISRYLKPGGRLVFVEFHPVVWMFDNDFSHIQYSYFRSDAIVEIGSGTYADKEADITRTEISWNHGMAEVIGSLIRHGLTINHLEEFDYSPYNCFKHCVEVGTGRFRISHLGNKIPMVYALTAVK